MPLSTIFRYMLSWHWCIRFNACPATFDAKRKANWSYPIEIKPYTYVAPDTDDLTTEPRTRPRIRVIGVMFMIMISFLGFVVFRHQFPTLCWSFTIWLNSMVWYEINNDYWQATHVFLQTILLLICSRCFNLHSKICLFLVCLGKEIIKGLDYS